MSVESQSERIWQYAMRSTPVKRGAFPAPLSADVDMSGGGGDGSSVPADLSEDLGPMPSQLNIHDLVPTQSQSFQTWLVEDKPAPPPNIATRTESQKENLQLFIPSRSQSPLLSNSTPKPASPPTATEMAGGDGKSSHVMQHVTGASTRADATIPPMDSKNAFAAESGAPGKERSAALRATPLKLNNKVPSLPLPTAAPPQSPPIIRRKTMPPRQNRYAPRDVHPSSQDSFAGPPIPQDLNAFARSSRILQNTFISTTATGGVEAVYHRPSDISSTSLSEPVADAISISQSDQPGVQTASQVVRAAFDPSLSPQRAPVVLVKDSQSNHESQDSETTTNSQVVSSSGSFRLPSPNASIVPTQLDTQTQPTQPLPPPEGSPDNIQTGPSPLPVPPHRKMQFAALSAARRKAKDEIIPETPQSVIGPSALKPKADPVSTSTDLLEAGPSSHRAKAGDASKTVDTAARYVSSRHTGATSHKHPPEIIPDSQEEESQPNVVHHPTSPPVPLRVLRSSPKRKSPAPTPAAATSTSLQSKRPSDDKGKGKERAIQDVIEEDNQETNEVMGSREADFMNVDNPKSPASSGRTYRSKRAAVAKRSPQALGKKDTKRSKASPTKTAAVTGPSTRSKRRRNDVFPESTPEDRMSPLCSAPKRQRKVKPTTPTPAPSLLDGTRVFARRVDKSNYYFPGTVKITAGPAASSRAPTVFRVKFDDGFEDDVDVQFMRRFELENSDNVHVKWPAKHKDCAAEVINAERWSGELVEVQELHLGPDGEDFEVSSRFISIPEARIRQQFSERRISSSMLRGDSSFDVPFDVPPKNERLAGVGFLLTLPDLPRGKQSLQKLITASGGVVYEEWDSLISLGGVVESPGRRMSGTRDNVRMKKDVPKQLFCLADEARTTPKYLIALALGVPCLSFRWVLEKVFKPNGEHQVDWPAYVLPAGYNFTTGMPGSQAFERAWWRTACDASNLISKPPIFKPFLGKSFLCFGTKEFLFAQDALGIFPKLILAMGASYLEAVTDVAHVKVPLAQFDYTVVDDGEEPLEYQSALAVDVWWIKKCLIAGIEGPVPWPDRD